MQFADRIVSALEQRSIEVLIDRRDLPKLEDWERELVGFIRKADTVLFIMTPQSISSKVVAWELEQVRLYNKRLAPILVGDIGGLQIPDDINRLNYIDFTDNSRFGERVDELVRALNTDVAWLKEHTRLGELALRWSERGRLRDFLMSAIDLADAEVWLKTRLESAPEPTLLQLQMIEANRFVVWDQRRLRRLLISGWILLCLYIVAVPIVYILQDNGTWPLPPFGSVQFWIRMLSYFVPFFGWLLLAYSHHRIRKQKGNRLISTWASPEAQQANS